MIKKVILAMLLLCSVNVFAEGFDENLRNLFLPKDKNTCEYFPIFTVKNRYNLNEYIVRFIKNNNNLHKIISIKDKHFYMHYQTKLNKKTIKDLMYMHNKYTSSAECIRTFLVKYTIYHGDEELLRKLLDGALNPIDGALAESYMEDVHIPLVMLFPKKEYLRENDFLSVAIRMSDIVASDIENLYIDKHKSKSQKTIKIKDLSYEGIPLMNFFALVKKRDKILYNHFQLAVFTAMLAFNGQIEHETFMCEYMSNC